MRYRKLGRTALNVSEISLGCSGFWGNKYFSEKEAISIVKNAFESGINLFDTGHNYSNYNAEPRLGLAIKSILTYADRSKLVVSTKAGTTIPSTRILYHRRNNVKNFDPDYIEETCKKSIKNLNCDYLDIFQLHGPSESDLSPELINRLNTMKKKGLYRYLGINTHNDKKIEYVLRNPNLFDVILLDYNVNQLYREPIIKQLNKMGIGIIAGTILAQGHIIKGKIGRIKSAADIWYLGRALLKDTGRRLALNSRAMKNTLALIENMSPAQAAFSYVLQNTSISSCVFGTTSHSNLLEIIRSTKKKLNNKQIELIRETYFSKKKR